jgi:hypothetical protein
MTGNDIEPTEQQRIDKEKRIKREKAKLRRLLVNMEPDRLRAAQGLIDTAAFLAVTLADLRAHLNEHGMTVCYQNGPNQSGVKQAPEAYLLSILTPQYRATFKLLMDLLPQSAPASKEDALMAWVSGDYQGADAALAEQDRACRCSSTGA